MQDKAGNAMQGIAMRRKIQSEIHSAVKKFLHGN